MRLLYYEFRKTYFRKYIFVVLVLFSVLNAIKIGVDYQQNMIDPVTAEGANTIKGYQELYQAMKGKITEGKKEFFNKENERLGEIYYKRLDNKNSNEKSYTGNLYEDYRILQVYIAEEFQYASDYHLWSDKIANSAEKNIGYYEKYNNEVKVKENRFIKEQYEKREITEFYRTKSLDSLLDYKFSIFLVLLICFLAIAPSFLVERECKMSLVLCTSKAGTRKSTIYKMVSSICFSVVCAIWFTSIDIITYKVLCGLNGLESPLYAIEGYRETFLNCTIFDFFIHEVMLRILAVVTLTMIILVLSSMIRRVLHVSIFYVVIVACLYMCSGGINSISMARKLLALVNPITLLNGQELYKSFGFLEFGNHFVLNSTVCIVACIVLCLFLIGMIFILQKGDAKRCK